MLLFFPKGFSVNDPPFISQSTSLTTVKSVRTVKVHSHLMSAFAIFLDLCHSILEHANVKYEHHHLICFTMLDANAQVLCEQGFTMLIGIIVLQSD